MFDTSFLNINNQVLGKYSVQKSVLKANEGCTFSAGLSAKV